MEIQNDEQVKDVERDMRRNEEILMKLRYNVRELEQKIKSDERAVEAFKNRREARLWLLSQGFTDSEINLMERVVQRASEVKKLREARGNAYGRLSNLVRFGQEYRAPITKYQVARMLLSVMREDGADKSVPLQNEVCAFYNVVTA